MKPGSTSWPHVIERRSAPGHAAPDLLRRRGCRAGKRAGDERAGTDLACGLEQLPPADLPVERRALGALL
jgi:hypothetical protein